MLNRVQVQWHDFKNTRADIRSQVKPGVSLDLLWLNLFALLFGMAPINGLYPFGLSFPAASILYRKKFVLPGLFSFAGIMISMKSPVAFRYLVTMLLFYVSFNVLKSIVRRKELLAGLLIFISNMVSGIIYLAVSGISPYDLLLLSMESGLASIVTFIIPAGLSGVFKVRVREVEKSICLAVLAGVVLSVAQGIKFYGIEVKQVLSVLAVLVMAMVGGPGAGATSGIIIGITGSSFAISPWIVTVLAFSGLIAGTFNKLGRIGAVLGFCLGYVIYNLYVNSMGEVLIPLSALAISSALLLLFPSWTFKSLEKYLHELPEETGRLNLNPEEILQEKLYETAAFIEELGRAFDDPVVSRDNLRSGEHLDRICQKVEESVCRDCGLYKMCWERELPRTMKSFYLLIRMYEAGNPANLPNLFRVRCKRTEDIKKIIKDFCCIYNLEKQMNDILKLCHEEIRQCFKGTASAIKELSKNLWVEDESSDVNERITERLSSMGVRLEHIEAKKDDERRKVSIVKAPCIGEKQCEALIPEVLSEAIGERFLLKVVDCPLRSGSQKCRLKAVSEGIMGVAVGAAGAAKDGYDISGDDFRFTELNEGRYLLAMSDGMGVGEMAAVHSERTLTLLEHLLKAGFSLDAALKITNTAMLATSVEETFSTVDVLLIDTYTGNADILKAGSASGFIKRAKKVDVIKGGTSLPVGIIDSVSPSVTHVRLKVGDMAVMVTDGIIDALSRNGDGEEELKKILSSLNTANPQEVADEILKKARMVGPVRDDMTVMAARLWRK